MKTTYFDNKGSKQDTLFDMGKDFDIEPNFDVIAQYNYTYLSNQRFSTAKAKGRGEVSGGGKKPWKQKGTGRARHGSSRSPIWKGGGVTFGPTGEQNYRVEMPKKMRKLAFKSAVAFKNSDKLFGVIDDPDVKKTADVEKLVKKLGIDAKKVLFIQADNTDFYTKFRNLKNINIVRVGEVNAYDILNGGAVVLIKSAVDQFMKLAN